MPWGDPDLEGIWPSTDMVGVPFERPAELAGRSEVSDEEFAARQSQSARQAERDHEQFVSTAPRTASAKDSLEVPTSVISLYVPDIGCLLLGALRARLTGIDSGDHRPPRAWSR